ncbi:ly6/PLAUR domain-containing protein 6B-like [Ischnura elegans]|uniref:ly6/PLAUR domain-containing protein 6B-like n=1 Tax=Ischnura elegans TaxID=197161 RepID=UPI001ED871AD|nr:ly6/PLAUR domain-containing protein 6B-like [Ischnura elegans]
MDGRNRGKCCGGRDCRIFRMLKNKGRASLHEDDPSKSFHSCSSASCKLVCTSQSSHEDDLPLLKRLHPRFRRTFSLNAPLSAPRLLLLGTFLLVCFLGGAAEARSAENYYGDGALTAEQRDTRITCYTCVNVSTNDECNRFAIDRPCPEGGDYCLTLHVMDSVDRDRSVLVNKRCASLDDCIGDATGCTSAYGQTQCVSCCDQPYCNDSVPSNSTNAVFYRSSASAVVVNNQQWGFVAWRIAAVIIPMFKLSALCGPS